MPEVCAALITIATMLSSMWISLIEYYWRKAYYDFFAVADFGRRGTRSFLAPDFLLYGLFALAVIASLAIVAPWDHFDSFLTGGSTELLPMGIAIAALSTISMLLGSLLFAVFNYGIKCMIHSWGDVGYARSSIVFGIYAALAVFGTAILSASVYVALHDLCHGDQMLSLGCAAVSALVLLPLICYRWCKMTISHWYKTAVFISAKGGPLIILDTVGDRHYCARCSLHNGTLYVRCNDVVLVSAQRSLRYRRRYFSNLVVERKPCIFTVSGGVKEIRNAANI